MIPNAHAVIFLLSVDTGVTASDLAIWNNFIATTDSDHRAGRFAVLNKIDMLWDDIQGEQHTQEAISQVHRKTAELLGLKREEVMLVSAKQADRKSTRLNSSHVRISYAVFCLKKKKS